MFLLTLITKFMLGSLTLCLTFAGTALTVGSGIRTDEVAFVVRQYNATQLYTVDVNRGIRTYLVGEIGPVKPSWSPDGSAIAFGNTVVKTSDVGVSVEGWVELAEADGRNIRRVLTHDHTILGVEWSPNGNVIAVEASSGIHLIDLEGSYLRKLTNGSELLWSPVGKEDIVVRGFDLYLINEQGATVRSIDTGARLVEVDESPDGEQLVFVTLFYYTTALQLMQLGDEHAPQRMVNMDYGCVRNPDWSPDGGRIAFDLRCAQPPGIYVVDADGGNLHLLVRANRGEILSQPAWRPHPH